MGVPLPHLVLPPFSFLWTSHRHGVSSPDGGLVPIVFALLSVHSCRVSFGRATLWTCGSLKGTQRDCEVVCVAIAVVGLTMVTPEDLRGLVG